MGTDRQKEKETENGAPPKKERTRKSYLFEKSNLDKKTKKSKNKLEELDTILNNKSYKNYITNTGVKENEKENLVEQENSIEMYKEDSLNLLNFSDKISESPICYEEYNKRADFLEDWKYKIHKSENVKEKNEIGEKEKEKETETENGAPP